MKYSTYARLTGMAGALVTTAGLLLWAGQPLADIPPAGDLGDRLIIAGIFSIPLLVALAGLARHRVYTAAWASMLAVVYMGYALAEFLINDAIPGLWLTLLGTSLFFAGSTLYPRLRSREFTASG